MPRRVIPTDLRDVDLACPVAVYWNLHRHRWSVRQDGIVRAHMAELVMHVTEWRVQPGGQRRVRREGRKHVHAFAIGQLYAGPSTGTEAARRETGVTVRYDPYRHDAFVAVGGYEGQTPAAARPPADYRFAIAARPDGDPSPRVTELRPELAAA